MKFSVVIFSLLGLIGCGGADFEALNTNTDATGDAVTQDAGKSADAHTDVTGDAAYGVRISRSEACTIYMAAYKELWDRLPCICHEVNENCIEVSKFPTCDDFLKGPDCSEWDLGSVQACAVAYSKMDCDTRSQCQPHMYTLAPGCEVPYP